MLRQLSKALVRAVKLPPRATALACAAASLTMSSTARAEDASIRVRARSIFEAGCEAADPYAAVRRLVRLEGQVLWVGARRVPLEDFERVAVLGSGKACIGMLEALQGVLGARITAGVAVTKHGHSGGHKLGPQFSVFEAGHPTPDLAGVEGTLALLAEADAADARTLVLVCVTGGSSALLCAPCDGISLAEKQQTTSALLESGCSINEKNAVLKHLSQVKGGSLLRRCSPATVITLVVSDVVGDPLDVIGSGPTVPDTSSFQGCLQILSRYQLSGKIAPSCLARLQAGAQGKLHETPKPGDRCFEGCSVELVASNKLATQACLSRACELGYHSMLLSSMVEGEAAQVGKVLAGVVKEIRASGQPVPPPACVVVGGETTVTVPEKAGLGGRNQALALSAAIEIAGMEGVAVLAGGTDGGDGPGHDATGAVVTGGDVPEGSRGGLDAHGMLKGCDSYRYFNELEKLKYDGKLNVLHLRDGVTGTNVADLTVLLVDTLPEGSR